jgi:arsenate reductase (thioredoxin)
MSTVLFVCLHNAGRSQMSQALLERAAAGRHTALSAGTNPGDHVHPPVVEVMREIGIDLSDRSPQLLTTELAEQADIVITMGCRDQCPVIPGKRYLDWELPDPKDRSVDEVRATRDDITNRVQTLLVELDADELRYSVEIRVAAQQGRASTPRDGGNHAVDHPPRRNP